MRPVIRVAVLATVVLGAMYGQTSGKAEFDAASIKANPSQPGFHLAGDTLVGGPGTADPGMFRCSQCSLAPLVMKAFNLKPYQFPGRASLAGDTYDIQAKVPAGATAEEFSVMLQNLLRERFGLTWHFQEKKMKGYRLVAGKDGPKLKESSGEAPPTAPGHAGQGFGAQGFGGQGETHNHSGVISFGGSASFRASNQTMDDLIRILSDQTGMPVDDGTGLKGKYDISLRWSGAVSADAGNHSEGAFAGGQGHTGHEGGGSFADPSGLTLFDALQQQLGLRLEPAQQAVAQLFVVDRVMQRPTDN